MSDFFFSRAYGKFHCKEKRRNKSKEMTGNIERRNGLWKAIELITDNKKETLKEKTVELDTGLNEEENYTWIMSTLKTMVSRGCTRKDK